MFNIEERKPLMQTQLPRDEGKVESPEDMLSIIKRAMNATLANAPVTAEDLLEEGPEKFRFRFDEFRFPREGVIGKVSPAGFYNMVLASVHDLLYRLGTLQANGEWNVIAWEVTSGTTQRKERYLGEARAWEQFKTVGDNTVGVPKPSKQQYHGVSHPTFILGVSVVDSTQEKETDNWHEETGRENSPLRRYMKTGDVAHLPKYLRESREPAIKLLVKFAAHEAAAVLESAKLEEAEETVVPDMTPIVVELRKKDVSVKRIQALTGLSEEEIIEMSGPVGPIKRKRRPSKAVFKPHALKNDPEVSDEPVDSAPGE